MANVRIASGPVAVQDGKVLLNKSGNDSFWKFCGGWVEDNDLNLLKTARREFKEEMGVDLELINPDPFLFHVFKETENGQMDIILVHYLIKVIGEIVSGDDVKKWAWISLEDLEKEDLAPNILPALRYFGFIK